MFKKIKKRLSLQRRVQIEVLETLATITQYLLHDRYPRNPCQQYLLSHFNHLKELSSELREEENSYARSK